MQSNAFGGPAVSDHAAELTRLGLFPNVSGVLTSSVQTLTSRPILQIDCSRSCLNVAWTHGHRHNDGRDGPDRWHLMHDDTTRCGRSDVVISSIAHSKTG